MVDTQVQEVSSKGLVCREGSFAAELRGAEGRLFLLHCLLSEKSLQIVNVNVKSQHLTTLML